MLYRLARAQRPGYRLDEWQGPDGIHPTNTGQRYLADLVIHYIGGALLGPAAAAPPLAPEERAAAAAPPPPPMLEGGGVLPAEACVQNGALVDVVVKAKGFGWSDRGGWGWVGLVGVAGCSGDGVLRREKCSRTGKVVRPACHSAATKPARTR